MPGWSSSNRKLELPPNWHLLRQIVLERDSFKCQHLDANTVEIDPDTGEETGEICGRPANQVDHKKRGGDHSIDNLQALCKWHHDRKSSKEGGEANAAKRKAEAEAKKPKHPGYYR